MTNETSDNRVTLAAISGAHGIAGEVRLKLFGDGIDGLKTLKQVEIGGRVLTIASLRPGASPILRFAEVTDRNAAELLRGKLITIRREALPPLGEGEYYHADILGLACVASDGTALGTVVAIENFGAGDILEIEKPDGRRSMVPFRDGVADLADGRVVVDPAFLT